jgi:Protein of unknown function (DUF3631)
MTTTTDDTLSAINQALREDPEPGACHACGRLLADSPSPDFCSEDCQATWLTAHGQLDTALADGGAHPDPNRPETTPARSLSWLGSPPAGAVLPAGHEVLDQVATFVRRFSVFPSEHCAPVLALWYAHTHMVDRFYVTPRLVLDSAEPGSGKTRVLEVAQLLVAAPEMTISATPSALFRMVGAGPITILFDEVDTIFNQSGGANEDLRGLLNAGYKAGATIARCVGDAKNMKVQRFPVFAPAALAGIAGSMPTTITTRAITIHMRKRRTDQSVEPFRARVIEHEARPIREALAAWIDTVADRVSDSTPDMPAGVVDRAHEIWEPLVAIADAAEGHWPQTARAACEHFVLNSGADDVSDGVRLLADLRALFSLHSTDRLSTIQLLTELRALDESPWGDLDGRQLDARRLARELARFSVRPIVFKDAVNAPTKGYVTYATDRQVGLADAWDRYLPPDPAQVGNRGNPGNTAGQAVTDEIPVTDASVTTLPPAEPGYRSIGNHETPRNPLTSEVTPVTAVTDFGED